MLDAHYINHIQNSHYEQISYRYEKQNICSKSEHVPCTKKLEEKINELEEKIKELKHTIQSVRGNEGVAIFLLIIGFLIHNRRKHPPL